MRPFGAALPALAIALTLAASSHSYGTDVTLELLAEREIAGDLTVDDTAVGGLSGLAYDPACDLFYALSDDRGNGGPYRLYALRVGSGPAHEVEVFEAIVLTDEIGGPIPRGELDLEAIAVDRDGTLYMASEGVALRGAPPKVCRFGLDGRRRGEMAVPARFVTSGGKRGVRNNLSFEGMVLDERGGRLILATENALLQDGPMADVDSASPSRILVLDRRTGAELAEYRYDVEPVPDGPRPATAFRTNGISELLRVDDHRLLVVERAFAAGVGNRVRLYLVDLRGGMDVRNVESFAEGSDAAARPLAKALVADLRDFGIAPDNIEAAAFGPELADGRRLLVMMSDNNFQPGVQKGQVLVFAASGIEPPSFWVPTVTIAQIQGAGHVSPFIGRCVAGAEGVVTAILGSRSGQAFWLQDPAGDDDPDTSEGLLVTASAGLQQVAIGDRARLAGRVEERRWARELPVTRLFATAVEVVETGSELPPPVVLGEDGLVIPQPEVASPDLAVFDPAHYAADAFESVEGMRVAIPEPVVVGPTSRYGESAVLPDGGRGAALRTGRGGLRLLPGNPNPQRLLVDDAIVDDERRLTVGDSLDGPIEGILHYSFGSYKVLNTAPLPPVVAGGVARERTGLVGRGRQLTVATYNVENLSAVSESERFERLAAVVVDALASPDIVALQEVQDDSGPVDDGTVSADATLRRIVDAIEAAGGPRYEWHSIAPVDGTSGGQPGGNIRNAFLVNPRRVTFLERGDCDARRETAADERLGVTCSPGLIATDHPAFTPGPLDDGGSRKPLIGQFRFAGRDLYLVNLHLASKGGDDRLFGWRQPPVAVTSELRRRQAEAVAEFVTTLRESDPGASVVVLGDLNDFEGSQPLAVLEAAGLEDLVRRLPAEARYTYVYLGNSQVLDHILVSRDLAVAAEVETVHANAEFPAAARASDHDPVIVRFIFDR